MRQLFFLSPGELEWREVAAPKIEGSGEALVEPIAVAACDLDAALISGKAPLQGPFRLGHEFIARVVEVGEDVAGFGPGQEVVVSFQISCGRCERCKRGITGSCTTVKPGSMYGLGAVGGEEWGGAFADLVRVPYADFMMFPLPAGVDPSAAASANDNVVDGWRTVGPHLAENPGADVLIVAGGAPSIGLYAVQIARALQAGRIDYIDRNKDRLAMAERLGASAIEGPPPHKAGRFPITVDAGASEESLRCAIRSTEAGGTCTSIGIYYSDVAFPLLEMYAKGITFRTGRPDSCALLPEALSLLETKAIDPAALHTVVPWDAAIEGILAGHTKLVVSRQG